MQARFSRRTGLRAVSLAESGSSDTGLGIMTADGIALIGIIFAYTSGRTVALVERVVEEQLRRKHLPRYFLHVAAQLAEAPMFRRSGAGGDDPVPRPQRETRVG